MSIPWVHKLKLKKYKSQNLIKTENNKLRQYKNSINSNTEMQITEIRKYKKRTQKYKLQKNCKKQIIVCVSVRVCACLSVFSHNSKATNSLKFTLN